MDAKWVNVNDIMHRGLFFFYPFLCTWIQLVFLKLVARLKISFGRTGIPYTVCKQLFPIFQCF